MQSVEAAALSDRCLCCFSPMCQELMKTVFGILNDQSSSPRDVSLAIRAQGKLAGAILKFSGEEELRKALNRLLPFGAQTTT